MKLVLKNDFAWDGLYWICDEAGVEKYYVDARVGDGDGTSMCTMHQRRKLEL